MFNEQEASSKTVQIQRKIVKIDSNQQKWAQLHIWDTLGQEKFKAVSPLFFRKAVGAFLVYDCTNKHSFDEIESWYQQLSNSIDTRVIIMLIGNKCDLPNREVPYNTAMEYARSRNFGFLEVSAKTGINIKNSFYCLVKEIYRNQTNQVDEPLTDPKQPHKKSEKKLKDDNFRLDSQVKYNNAAGFRGGSISQNGNNEDAQTNTTSAGGKKKKQDKCKC
eukprot:403352329